MAVTYNTTRQVTPSPSIEFQKYDTDGKPSWKRYFEGRTRDEIKFRATDKFIEIVASELAYPDDPDKRVVEKLVFLDLNRDQALALRDYLNEIYSEEG